MCGVPLKGDRQHLARSTLGKRLTADHQGLRIEIALQRACLQASIVDGEVRRRLCVDAKRGHAGFSAA